MINALKKLMDSFGWKTDRQLVLITSDDWGSIRVESEEIRNRLMLNGLKMDGNRFNRFDTLESNLDMEMLFEVLLRYTDKQGRHPVVTAMTNVANPDFERIEAAAFEQYFYEPFLDTLQRYPNHDQVFALYKEGVKQHIFVPEFHGREHLNINRLMSALQSGHEKVLLAFESRFCTLDREDLLPGLHKGFGAAYDVDTAADLDRHMEILRDGLHLFESIFGYKATFFTAPSLLFNPALEKTLYLEGVEMVDVPKNRRIPLGNGQYKKRFYPFGKKNRLGQTYITRNAVFEPNMGGDFDPVARCLEDVKRAFRAKKPAIISNHRAAFVGGIEPLNRQNGLRALDSLLGQLTDQYTDIEFISIRELQRIMKNDGSA